MMASILGAKYLAIVEWLDEVDEKWHIGAYTDTKKHAKQFIADIALKAKTLPAGKITFNPEWYFNSKNVPRYPFELAI